MGGMDRLDWLLGEADFVVIATGSVDESDPWWPTFSTSRFWTVVRRFPVWPGSARFLNVLAGSAAWPRMNRHFWMRSSN